MFKTKGHKIEMTEGDFGIVLPFELILKEGETIDSGDVFKINIYKEINADPIVAKEYTNIQNNTIDFVLSENDTELLEVGSYYYDLDWYSGETLLNNIIPEEDFEVIEKAGKVGEEGDVSNAG